MNLIARVAGVERPELPDLGTCQEICREPPARMRRSLHSGPRARGVAARTSGPVIGGMTRPIIRI